MSGIFGIISKKNTLVEGSIYANALQSMKLKSFTIPDQKSNSIVLKNCCFANVVAISAKTNENFIHNKEHEIYCIIDGLVYIEPEEKLFIQNTYKLDSSIADNEYIPYLYNQYKAGYTQHLSGWFNIFICDAKNEEFLLSNDRLGLLPLYYFESDSIFIFASKIECILASGLMPKIEFDAVTISEYLLFNYSVSANTFIKNISTLPAAVNCTISDSFIQSVYFYPSELISETPLSKNKSLDLIDAALKKSIDKPFSKNNDPVCATLTGGWDGRLILSYMLTKYHERLRVFSFGSELSPDITIPIEIASHERFSYKPFILDQNYINVSFLDAACSTIQNSNGMRSYRRSHYMFATKQLSSVSQTFISGNFGDEMFKFAQVLPSEVITKELISLIQTDFTLRPQLRYDYYSPFSNLLNNQDIQDELYARLDAIEKEVSSYESVSQKYNHLKLTRIAGKYFGTEINSYNDFIGNFSPFLDFDFITAFSKTCFSGIYYPFNGNKLKHKEMSSMIYAELIKRNNRDLLHYKTDRGFSMADTMHPIGKLTVLYKKKFNKRPNIKDPYFLEQADNLFQSFNENFSREIKMHHPGRNFYLEAESNDTKGKDKIISLIYWMNYISNEYLN
jgi:asparagine synthetase B (glutamine-hydrolysing)